MTPRNEPAGATLLSNHPPGSGEGFTIRMDAAGGGVCDYAVGDGQDPAHTLRFRLDDGRVNDLVITADGGSLKACVNGRVAGFVDDAPLLKNSGSGLAIGNDLSLERPFNGTIDEVRIAGDAVA